jgi:hypothetical protein
MIRIIHVPELHYSPATAKNTLYAMKVVAETAKTYAKMGEGVYVLSTGDVHDRSLQATERQGFPELIDAVAEIASSCKRFIMMYGTRSSHDIEGSYKAYEFIPNVTVLSAANRMFYDGNISVFSFEEPMPSEYKNEDVFSYTNKTAALAMAFFAHQETKLKIIMAHGTILCDETANDASTKFGGVHYNEVQFVDSGADLALAGHLHHGFQFHNIVGGYAHSLAHTYSDDGFVPDFKVYSYEHTCEGVLLKKPEVRSVALALPARFNVGVKATVDSLDIDMKDCGELSGFVYTGIAPKIKPRVTIEKSANTTAVRQSINDELKARFPFAEIDYPEIREIREETARNVDLKSAQSYREQAKRVYPDWTEKDLAAMDWLEEEDQKDGTIPSEKVITPKYFTVRGYKPFRNGLGKDEIHVDFSEFGSAVVGLVAPGGSGKSSMSDLVYPHAECLSQPASKTELFGLSDSFFRYCAEVNGDEVLCEIKGNAETQKFVYSCSVNGVEKCKKGLKEYKEVVNQIFGTIHEYALVVVRTQFVFPRIIDGVPVNPNIKYATNKELKDVYNALIGNDKSKTQKRCKDKADAFKEDAQSEKSKLSGVRNSIESIETETVDEDLVKLDIDTASKELSALDSEFEKVVSEIATISLNVEKRSEIEKRYKSARVDLIDAEEKLAIPATNAKIAQLEEESGKVDSYKSELSCIDEIARQNEVIASRNTEKMVAYQAKYSEWSDVRNAVMKERERITELANSKKADLQTIKDVRSENVAEISKIDQWLSLVKSCPKCGFVDEAVEAQRKEKTEKLATLKNSIIGKNSEVYVLETEIEGLRSEYSAQVFTDPEPQKPTAEPTSIVPARSVVQSKIDAAQGALVKIAELKAKLSSGASEIARINGEIASLKDALDLIPDVSEKRNELVLKKSDIERGKSEKQAKIDGLRATLAKVQQNRALLAKLRADAEEIEKAITVAENGYNDWSRYQKAWGKDGIPARFVELEAPIVDSMANEMLSRFYPKLYIESKTSRIGSDGSVLDDFDVRVYNTEEGTEQSLYSISGEQANFVLSALYFAFRQAYTRNKHVSVSLYIEDEPDAHVGVDKQGTFCDMVRYQQNIENKLRLYISHSPEVQSLLEKVIYLQDL